MLSAFRYCVVATIFLVFVLSDRAQGDEEIDKLVKELRHKEVKVRIRAAEGLGKKGGEAATAAKPLCDAMLDLSPQVATAALESLEKVRPDLYKPLSTLILDKTTSKRLEAVRELGLLGEKAAPVANILIVQLRVLLAARTSSINPKSRIVRGLNPIEREYFSALAQINSDDPEIIRLHKAMASPVNNDAAARLEALMNLHKWAALEDSRKKEVAPFVKAALDNQYMQIQCLEIIGQYGALAKDALPFLRKLKLSSDMKVREAAAKAVDQIENP